jgi:hypothetical protein
MNPFRIFHKSRFRGQASGVRELSFRHVGPDALE